jgi:hypothetical protein
MSAVSAVLVALLAPAVARATPAGLIVLNGRGTRTVTVSGSEQSHMAALTLLVRNGSDRTRTAIIRYLPSKASESVIARAHARSLKAGEVAQMQVAFTLRAAREFSGTLVLGVRGQPRRREITIAVASAAPAGSAAAIEPEEVTLHLTSRCFGLPSVICGSKTSAVAWVSKSVLARTSLQTRLASSSNGNTAEVTLAGSESNARRSVGSLVPAEVTARAPDYGSYSTTFLVGEEGKHDAALKVTVDVQEWWLWPFGILVLGAILGYGTRWLAGPYRDRLTLMAALADARDDYDKRRAARASGLYSLRRWFGDAETDTPPVPTRRECRGGVLTGFAKLWCRLSRASSGEDLKTVKPKAERLCSDVAIWGEVDDALKALESDVKRLAPSAEQNLPLPKIYKDTFALTRYGIAEPTKAGEPETMIAALYEQGEVIGAYESARAAWDASDATTKAEQEEYDPDKIYGKAKAPLRRSPTESASLKAELLGAAREVEARFRTMAVSARFEHLKFTLPHRFASSAPLGMHVPFAMGQRVAEAVKHRRQSPRVIRRSISRMDSMVFSVTLLVSVATYLLTIYKGGTFGGLPGYVEAFAAGFGGQALVGVTALPFAKGLVSAPKS